MVHSSEPLESILVYDIMGKMVDKFTVENDQFIASVGNGMVPGIYMLQENLNPHCR